MSQIDPITYNDPVWYPAPLIISFNGSVIYNEMVGHRVTERVLRFMELFGIKCTVSRIIVNDVYVVNNYVITEIKEERKYLEDKNALNAFIDGIVSTLVPEPSEINLDQMLKRVYTVRDVTQYLETGDISLLDYIGYGLFYRIPTSIGNNREFVLYTKDSDGSNCWHDKRNLIYVLNKECQLGYNQATRDCRNNLLFLNKSLETIQVIMFRGMTYSTKTPSIPSTKSIGIQYEPLQTTFKYTPREQE